MPHDCRVDFVDRDLDPRPARPDPSGRVLRQPTDNLACRAVLGCVVSGGNIGMQFRGERPRLRSVDDDFDEPNGVVVVAQPSFCRAGIRFETGDPGLITVTSQRRESTCFLTVRCDVAVGESAALGEVIVIGAAAVGLDIVPSRRRSAAINLQSAAHRSIAANDNQQKPPKNAKAAPTGAALLPILVAFVPLFGKDLNMVRRCRSLLVVWAGR